MSVAIKSRPPQISERVETSHGRYRIVAGRSGEDCKALAFLDGLGMTPVATHTAGSVDDAVSGLIEELDERRAILERTRRDGVPSSTEFIEAIAALPLQFRTMALDLLPAHARFPDANPELSDLARRTRQSEEELLKCYTAIGKRIGVLLNFQPSANPHEILVETSSAEDTGAADRWRLRPEIAIAALELCHRQRT